MFVFPILHRGQCCKRNQHHPFVDDILIGLRKIRELRKYNVQGLRGAIRPLNIRGGTLRDWNKFGKLKPTSLFQLPSEDLHHETDLTKRGINF